MGWQAYVAGVALYALVQTWWLSFWLWILLVFSGRCAPS
jgi:hypothetical protein